MDVNFEEVFDIVMNYENCIGRARRFCFISCLVKAIDDCEGSSCIECKYHKVFDKCRIIRGLN